MLIDAAIHRIRAYAEHKGWSAEKYGSVAGIPPSTARDVLKHRGNPTAETLRAMEAVIPARWKAPRVPPPAISDEPPRDCAA